MMRLLGLPRVVLAWVVVLIVVIFYWSVVVDLVVIVHVHAVHNNRDEDDRT